MDLAIEKKIVLMGDRNLKKMKTIQHDPISKFFLSINFIWDSNEKSKNNINLKMINFLNKNHNH